METIESFVTKLQTEGVLAGRKAAEEIRAQAQKEAADIIGRAQGQAREIVSGAAAEAEKIRAKTSAALRLAARDALAKLAESAGKAATAVLARRVTQKLSDAGFLEKLLREIILAYAAADAGKRGNLKINLTPEMRRDLADRTLGEISGNLPDAGFEYKSSGATIEVTADSVVDVLRGMVGPEIRNLIDEAVR